MLTAVITGPTLQEVKKQLECAIPFVDSVEFRLDLIQKIEIEPLIRACKVLVILTLRGASNEEREYFLKLKPDFMDIEQEFDFSSLVEKYPDTEFICSYHDFDKTPQDLDYLLKKMQRPGVKFYKIACFARSTLDALKMLIFSQKSGSCITGISMGEMGQLTRILGPVVQNAFDYTCLDASQNVLGQIDLKTLIEVYHYKKIKPTTSLFGLVGNPISHSIGHLFHNDLFKNREAIYCKMPLIEKELSEFFDLIKKLPFKGLSVTTPLKRAVCNYLDEHEMEAINTIVIKGEKKLGWNTDGKGAINVLERRLGSIRKKKLVIIGAGGAACAIAREALQRGAFVMIANRSQARACELAEELSCQYCLLENIFEYEILIQAASVDIPVLENQILPKTVVMDIRYGGQKSLLKRWAKEKDCLFIDGVEMFKSQAILQQGLFRLCL